MDTGAPTAIEMEVPQPATNGLGSLPVELLFRIARHLSTLEFCALRLSCRAVEQGLFHTFSHEFFSRKQFMISEFGLQALVDIARHPNLSKKLEHVSFGLEQVEDFHIDPGNSVEKVRFYVEAVSDQSTIFSSGRAVEMLTEAFTHLRNLKTVSIRDWNSRSRFRDFNSGLYYWNSYGFPTVTKFVGRKLAVHDYIGWRQFTTNVFSAVTTALAKAGARPENIEVILRGINRSVLDPGFWVPRNASEGSKYMNMLAGVRKLHLVIDANHTRGVSYYATPHSSLFPPGTPILDSNRLELNVNCNRYISYTAPSLEWLRINFHANKDEDADAFLAFFTNPRNSKHSEDRIVYPKLKQLDIGRLDVAPTSLYAMLEGLPTIETLVLYHVRLTSNNSSPPLPGPGASQWQKLLVRLPTFLPKLQRVEVYEPEEFVSGLCLTVLHERDHRAFTIQVEAGEGIMHQCIKVAARLGYRKGLDEDANSDDSDDAGLGENSDFSDDGGQETDDVNAMD